MSPETVVVGALARVSLDQRHRVCRRLTGIDGVSTFELPSEHQLGVLIESDSLDAAHATLTSAVVGVDGVLSVWPVSVELEDKSQAARFTGEFVAL